MTQEQTQEKQQAFLDKVITNTSLETVNEAQTATKVTFRILRDCLPREEVDKLADELRGEEAPKADMEVKDLWKDPNPMVSFFSYISPAQNLNISKDVFLLRLKQEGAVRHEADAETVTKAVFKATKDELSQEQVSNVAKSITDNELSQLWQQA
ncbi:DUF2267 domain-containing protein [Myxosarcina sp. GI1]|uniref:DUF2267 domain-containing protein n=1 Tax=Myxosarcina sp. GI1 TaxID=1541065 RepID=UPI00055D57CD|nr:DUF2267 domain-containing protein [Myxosarcina sp. GI1]